MARTTIVTAVLTFVMLMSTSLIAAAGDYDWFGGPPSCC